jgi:hypothetical protein
MIHALIQPFLSKINLLGWKIAAIKAEWGLGEAEVA